MQACPHGCWRDICVFVVVHDYLLTPLCTLLSRWGELKCYTGKSRIQNTTQLKISLALWHTLQWTTTMDCLKWSILACSRCSLAPVPPPCLYLTAWIVQVCLYNGIPVDPDERDRYPHSVSLPTVDDFIQKHFQGVSREPAILELCMFTMTVSGCGSEYKGCGYKIQWVWLERTWSLQVNTIGDETKDAHKICVQ